MILVLFLLVALITILLIFATHIRIECSNLYVTNIPEFQYDFRINIGLYLFKKIKLLETTISKENFKNSKIIEKLKKCDFFHTFSFCNENFIFYFKFC